MKRRIAICLLDDNDNVIRKRYETIFDMSIPEEIESMHNIDGVDCIVDVYIDNIDVYIGNIKKEHIKELLDE